MVRIALDAMGGDGAPEVPVAGAIEAVSGRAGSLEVQLVGDPSRLRPLTGDPVPEGLTIVPASETIEMGEAPVSAVRRKRDSSIVVGLERVRAGRADAFLSAGSTGAIMAASLLRLGCLPGVDRPAVGTMFPTARGATLVLDCGANASAKPSHLHRFAHLGSVYVRDLLRVERPRVGLLNVGAEPGKGDEETLAAYGLLDADPALHFVGNVEGHRIIRGDCDVLVCDGFTGNVLLKFYESMAGFLTGLLRSALGPEAGVRLQDVFALLDYTEYGGAPLLGIDGISVVCHGASPPNAIKNAIRVAERSVESGLVADAAADLAATAFGDGPGPVPEDGRGNEET